MSEKLTQNRQAVLNVLTQETAAMSAYDILDKLHQSDNKWKPATVYRALNFLIEANLAHKIESEQKFISCGHQHREHDRHFLICEHCGSVEERMLSSEAKQLMVLLAEQSQFQLRDPYLEFRGNCKSCAEHLKAV